MEVTCSTETSLDFHWTMQRYIPQDRRTLCTGLIFLSPDGSGHGVVSNMYV
jgi:hypothetical protein